MTPRIEKAWYAIYVKSRHEFIAHKELLNKGIEAYLPIVRKMRQWRDRRKSIEFPLFPGYLFIRVDTEHVEMRNVLKTRGVVALLCSEKGYPASLADEEIESLKRLLESGEEIDIYPHLSEGMKVMVDRGPLSGAIGTIARKDEHYMLLVSIELLGRSVGVKIYADDLTLA